MTDWDPGAYDAFAAARQGEQALKVLFAVDS